MVWRGLFIIILFYYRKRRRLLSPLTGIVQAPFTPVYVIEADIELIGFTPCKYQILNDIIILQTPTFFGSHCYSILEPICNWNWLPAHGPTRDDNLALFFQRLLPRRFPGLLRLLPRRRTFRVLLWLLPRRWRFWILLYLLLRMFLALLHWDPVVS